MFDMQIFKTKTILNILNKNIDIGVLIMVKLCTNCGAQLDDDYEFCSECGNKINENIHITVENKKKQYQDI